LEGGRKQGWAPMGGVSILSYVRWISTTRKVCWKKCKIELAESPRSLIDSECFLLNANSQQLTAKRY